jgi:hypothetical protein
MRLVVFETVSQRSATSARRYAEFFFASWSV